MGHYELKQNIIKLKLPSGLNKSLQVKTKIVIVTSGQWDLIGHYKRKQTIVRTKNGQGGLRPHRSLHVKTNNIIIAKMAKGIQYAITN